MRFMQACVRAFCKWTIYSLLATVGLWGPALQIQSAEPTPNSSSMSTSADSTTGDSKNKEQPLSSEGANNTHLPINIPEEYELVVAAQAPLVNHPMMACLDPSGALYVCENAGVNLSAQELEAQLPNSIRKLEDRNGDGIYDHVTVFADQMTFPMGAVWKKGSLYVASPPYIWKLTDHDQDGIAEDRQILVGKFGYTGNAASIHGCFLGPEGRIYWCDGFHGHEFRDEQGTLASKRIGSYLFSCRDDGTDVQIHCGGGMDNPVEVDFMPNGDMLGTVNIILTRPRVDALVHWLPGGTYPHRETVLQELKLTGDFLTPMHPFGHVAVSGATRYRSGLLNSDWKNQFFVTFFNSGKVVRLEISPQGSTYTAKQFEFLSSDDRDFHPTDVLEDADGSLLVLNTGGWFYRGCPTSQLAKPEIGGGVYRIRSAKTRSVSDPRGEQIIWKSLSTQELASLLTDARPTVQEQALTESVRRGAPFLAELQNRLPENSVESRRNVIWVAARILNSQKSSAQESNIQAEQILVQGLSDTDFSVQQAACHTLQFTPVASAREALLMLLQSSQPAVRRQAATALGKLGDPAVVPALLSALPQAVDREEEHALIYALIEINAPRQTVLGLKSTEVESQRGAVIALDQTGSDLLTPQQIIKFWSQLAEAENSPAQLAFEQTLLQVLGRHAAQPEWGAAVAVLLQEWLSGQITPAQQEKISQLITTFAQQEAVAIQIGRAVEDPAFSETSRRALWSALAHSSGVALHPSWTKALNAELNSGNEQQVELALETVAALRSRHFDAVLQQIVLAPENSLNIRIKALSIAQAPGQPLSSEAFAILSTSVETPGRTALAYQAVQVLSRAQLSAEQLLELTSLLPSAGPALFPELVRLISKSSNQAVLEKFWKTVEKSPFSLSLASEGISQQIARYPATVQTLAQPFLQRLQENERHQQAQLKTILPLVEQGDAEQGRMVFFSEKAKCSTCHQVQQQGKAVGPDLSGIGLNRSPLDLLESILFPSSTIVRDYESYTIVLDDGRLLTGLLIREDARTLDFQQSTGEIRRISRDQIEEIRISNISLMPNGWEKTLTEQELADVVAFLISMRQQNRPAMP